MKKNIVILLIIQIFISTSNAFAMDQKEASYDIVFKDAQPTEWKFINSPYDSIKLENLVGQSGLIQIKEKLLAKKQDNQNSIFGKFLDKVNVYFYLDSKNASSIIPKTQMNFSQPLYVITVEDASLVQDTPGFLEKLKNYSLSIPASALPRPIQQDIPQKPIEVISTPPNKPSYWYNNPYVKYIGGASAGLIALVFAAYKFNYLPTSFDFIQNKMSQFFSNALPHNTKQ